MQAEGVTEGEMLGQSFDLLGEFENAVDLHIDNLESSHLAGFVQDTTRKRLTATMQEGLQQNETEPELLARARGVFAEARTARAETIARTEVTRSIGFVDQLAQKSIGVTQKEWITAEDAEVRPTHAAADGQTVDIDAPFQVGNSYGPYPGAMSDPAENYNCRCVSAAVGIERAIVGRVRASRESNRADWERYAQGHFVRAFDEQERWFLANVVS